MPYSKVPLPPGRQAAFDALYDGRLLGAHETISGAGSRLINTCRLRKALTRMFARGAFTSVLDAGCGDFNWLSAVPMPGVKYLGVDIVAGLIEENRRRWPGYAFEVTDIVEQVPGGYDLILCKDVFTHLPIRDAMLAFNAFKKSGARYVGLTNLYPEYAKKKFIESTRRSMNQDAKAGYWHPVNMTYPPFNLPPPLVSMPEQQPLKTLDIWALDNLPLFRVPCP